MSIRSAKAVAIGIFVGYILPGAIFWLIGQAAVRISPQVLGSALAVPALLLMFFFGPIFTGYFTAKYSPYLPYCHALGAITLVLIWVAYRGTVQSAFFFAVLAIVSLLMTALGARRFKQEQS